jgi:PAS domain S-box-containing protein
MTEMPSTPELSDLAQLRDHLDRLRSSSDLAPEMLVQDLETVYEELRTSEEEVRVQQEQIARLVADHAADRRDQDRMLALLPVPVLTTDEQGVIRVANTAAAALMRMAGDRLVGKPLLALVSTGDRPHLRRRLSEGVREQPARQVVSFMRRDESALTMEVVLSPRAGHPGELTWILLAAEGQDDLAAESRMLLSSALMSLAGLLPTVEDLHTLLTEAATIVGDAVGGDVAVSLAVGSPMEPTAVGYTPGPAQQLDGAQVVAGEGPTADAYTGRATVVSDDLRTDRRWPRLVDRLPDGVGAVAAAPMTPDGAVRGVLTVYLRPGRAPAGVEHSVSLLADTVGVLVSEMEAKAHLAGLAEDLRRAMESRAVIEQAKGIVMAERHCDDQEAFAHLVRLSSTSHVKLRDVARTVVERARDG